MIENTNVDKQQDRPHQLFPLSLLLGNESKNPRAWAANPCPGAFKRSTEGIDAKETHRVSCHRCGNIRKSRILCSECPYVFCNRCVQKMKQEHGPNVFQNGCPVCKDLCCCGSKKSQNCERIYHCYKKCPKTRTTTISDLASNYRERISQSVHLSQMQQADSQAMFGILDNNSSALHKPKYDTTPSDIQGSDTNAATTSSSSTQNQYRTSEKNSRIPLMLSRTSQSTPIKSTHAPKGTRYDAVIPFTPRNDIDKLFYNNSPISPQTDSVNVQFATPTQSGTTAYCPASVGSDFMGDYGTDILMLSPNLLLPSISEALEAPQTNLVFGSYYLSTQSPNQIENNYTHGVFFRENVDENPQFFAYQDNMRSDNPSFMEESPLLPQILHPSLEAEEKYEANTPISDMQPRKIRKY